MNILTNLQVRKKNIKTINNNQNNNVNYKNIFDKKNVKKQNKISSHELTSNPPIMLSANLKVLRRLS